MQLNLKSLFSIVLVAFIVGCGQKADNAKLSFWDNQRKGANGDANEGTLEWFQAAESFGIEYIRLSPADMKSDSKDFLIGDIDQYSGIPPNDLALFKAVLDRAAQTNVKVVITFFGIPGARWRQHNNGEFDFRLWEDFDYHDQCAQFWTDLATELKDHPAVVGYNIINEPHPERKDGFQSGRAEEFETWLKINKGTAADLHLFYQTMVDAVRQVDSKTPVMFDARFHANAQGFDFFQPVKGNGILYAFHFYDPWTFSTFRINNGRFSYPDKMPTGDGDKTVPWTREDLAKQFEPVHNWAKRHQIPNKQIVSAEIGCNRQVDGAQQYLTDVIQLMNENDWHWAFYSFRSGSWDGMDYELGTEKLGWKYWEGIDAGKSHYEMVNRHNNPLWQVILDGLQN
ncbi:MAG: cellulase family glycosylhydrolase [Verrucomicrobia bacterium]|nr:cellulase family glycosylhydrolase [Verrucomicrobiota bacterium]